MNLYLLHLCGLPSVQRFFALLLALPTRNKHFYFLIFVYNVCILLWSAFWWAKICEILCCIYEKSVKFSKSRCKWHYELLNDACRDLQQLLTDFNNKHDFNDSTKDCRDVMSFNTNVLWFRLKWMWPWNRGSSWNFTFGIFSWTTVRTRLDTVEWARRIFSLSSMHSAKVTEKLKNTSYWNPQYINPNQ